MARENETTKHKLVVNLSQIDQAKWLDVRDHLIKQFPSMSGLEDPYIYRTGLDELHKSINLKVKEVA